MSLDYSSPLQSFSVPAPALPAGGDYQAGANAADQTTKPSFSDLMSAQQSDNPDKSDSPGKADTASSGIAAQYDDAQSNDPDTQAANNPDAAPDAGSRASKDTGLKDTSLQDRGTDKQPVAVKDADVKTAATTKTVTPNQAAASDDIAKAVKTVESAVETLAAAVKAASGDKDTDAKDAASDQTTALTAEDAAKVAALLATITQGTVQPPAQSGDPASTQAGVQALLNNPAVAKALEGVKAAALDLKAKLDVAKAGSGNAAPDAGTTVSSQTASANDVVAAIAGRALAHDTGVTPPLSAQNLHASLKNVLENQAKPADAAAKTSDAKADSNLAAASKEVTLNGVPASPQAGAPAATSSAPSPQLQIQTQTQIQTTAAKAPEAVLASGLSAQGLDNITAMSAQINKRLSANKTAHFDMELHPADMGRVDVRLSISKDGTMTAALSFNSPVAETQFKSQADELRRQLEQQGFQLNEGSLSFASRGDGQNPQNQNRQNPDAGSAFPDAAPDADISPEIGIGAFSQTQQQFDALPPSAQIAQKLGLTLLGGQSYRASLNVTA